MLTSLLRRGRRGRRRRSAKRPPDRGPLRCRSLRPWTVRIFLRLEITVISCDNILKTHEKRSEKEAVEEFSGHMAECKEKGPAQGTIESQARKKHTRERESKKEDEDGTKKALEKQPCNGVRSKTEEQMRTENDWRQQVRSREGPQPVGEHCRRQKLRMRW